MLGFFAEVLGFLYMDFSSCRFNGKQHISMCVLHISTVEVRLVYLFLPSGHLIILPVWIKKKKRLYICAQISQISHIIQLEKYKDLNSLALLTDHSEPLRIGSHSVVHNNVEFL